MEYKKIYRLLPFRQFVTVKSTFVTFLLAALALTSMSIGSCKKHENASCPITLKTIASARKATVLICKPSSRVAGQNVLHIAVDPCEFNELTSLKNDSTYYIEDTGTICTPNGIDDEYWSLIEKCHHKRWFDIWNCQKF